VVAIQARRRRRHQRAQHRQGQELLFHFTIQRKFEENFKTTIKQIEGLTGNQFNVSYSEQDIETDSFVFDTNGDLVSDDNGNALRRPAGHGALIGNLQQLNSELIFVKNIDNVQHYSKSKKSIELWSALGSLLLSFRKELLDLKESPTIEKLKQINEHFQVYTPSEITSVKTETDILKLINIKPKSKNTFGALICLKHKYETYLIKVTHN
jgi:hypothetical protein